MSILWRAVQAISRQNAKGRLFASFAAGRRFGSSTSSPSPKPVGAAGGGPAHGRLGIPSRTRLLYNGPRAGAARRARAPLPYGQGRPIARVCNERRSPPPYRRRGQPVDPAAGLSLTWRAKKRSAKNSPRRWASRASGTTPRRPRRSSAGSSRSTASSSPTRSWPNRAKTSRRSPSCPTRTPRWTPNSTPSCTRSKSDSATSRCGPCSAARRTPATPTCASRPAPAAPRRATGPRC